MRKNPFNPFNPLLKKVSAVNPFNSLLKNISSKSVQSVKSVVKKISAVNPFNPSSCSVGVLLARLVHFLLWQAAKPSGDKCTP